MCTGCQRWPVYPYHASEQRASNEARGVDKMVEREDEPKRDPNVGHVCGALENTYNNQVWVAGIGDKGQQRATRGQHYKSRHRSYPKSVRVTTPCVRSQL